jgi:hypothetical protein
MDLISAPRAGYCAFAMPRFYEPDLSAELDSPFARDPSNNLVRRGYWLDMNDRSLVMAMTNGIGAHLTNDEKRAHLTVFDVSTSLTKFVFRKFCIPRKSKQRCYSRAYRRYCWQTVGESSAA